MTTIKRLLLFTLFIACTCISVFAAEPDFRVGDLYYKVDSWADRTCIVWGPGEVNYSRYKGGDCPSGDVIIPESVEYNGVKFKVVKIQGFDNTDRESPFFHNKYITSVFIPSSVKVIRECAFQSCSNLVRVIMEGGDTIGTGAFAECKKLEQVSLSKNLKCIGYKCFYNCYNISSELIIPASCEWIGAYAFEYCHKISFYIEDSSNPLKVWHRSFFGGEDIYIGRPIRDGNPQRPGWQQGYGGHACVYTFRNVKLGNSVDEMPFFSVQTGLENVYDSDWLQTLYIGTSIETVRNLDVDYIRLKAIYLGSSTPPAADGFNASAFLNTIVYVTKGSLSAYRSAPVWKNFVRIMEYGEAQRDIKSVSDLQVSGWKQGHEYVDLGLPSGTLWATCNIGADKPWEFGDYFAWGETNTKDNFTYDNYSHCSWDDTCKYFNDNMLISDEESEYNLNKLRILEPEDDAASANWGGNWRIPTAFEWNELITYCKWSKLFSSCGYKVTGPNGNAIFLPMAGNMQENELIDACMTGFYWASTYWYGYYFTAEYVDHIWFGAWVDENDNEIISPENIVPFAGLYPYFGTSVRPVWSSTSAKESLRESIINLDKEKYN